MRNYSIETLLKVHVTMTNVYSSSPINRVLLCLDYFSTLTLSILLQYLLDDINSYLEKTTTGN